MTDQLWGVLKTKYSEEGRYYHTLAHINSLLLLSAKYESLINDKIAVDLAIFIHDIIYDPKSKSKSNEEESAKLFKEALAPYVDKHLIDKVYTYIIETKAHAVSQAEDGDLKLFIDFDMSILGSNRSDYAEYAKNIRKEYEFIPQEDYCKGRASVLNSFVNGDTSGNQAKFIFATSLFRDKMEAKAHSNLRWECEILSSGNLVQ